MGAVLRFGVIVLEKKQKVLGFGRLVSYVLVASLAAFLTYSFCTRERADGMNKLEKLSEIVDERFIGNYDQEAAEDAAAAAIISSLGDRWSYYIPASEYQSHVEQLENSYVGIGVTVSQNPETKEFEIVQVEPNGGAKAAGIQPGDVLLTVAGKDISQLSLEQARSLIRGEENTTVVIQVRRDGETYGYTVTRQVIERVVASGQLLEGNIGLVKISNFDERCAEETIAAIEEMRNQGAKALIFDVRYNPGGYRKELVKVLDYLLPEGVLFRSLAFNGEESEDRSDAACLEMPMAVLVNGNSYSAAEFFAAALSEYEWATVIGEQTEGKSYFQNTIELGDGSAIGLSVGKYFTPNGVSLAEVGGLVPDVEIIADEQTAALIYSGTLEPANDPQIQAAVRILQSEF